MIRLADVSARRPCQLCGQETLERFEIPHSSLLWHCPDCELYQFGQVVGEEAYPIDYHAGYARRRPQKIRTANLRLRRLAAAWQAQQGLSNPLPTGLRLLEIGCSVGTTLEAATTLGWQATGVDVSRSAVDVCRQHGLCSHQVGPLELPFPDASFDLLVHWHVVEHVADVRQSLREWQRVLKPGGMMMLETPDASSPKVQRLGPRYRKFWAPEHTYTFNPHNLSQFLREEGWDICEFPRSLAWSGMSPQEMTRGRLYQTYMSLRRAAGIQKAFQLIARRPLKQRCPSTPVTLANWPTLHSPANQRCSAVG